MNPPVSSLFAEIVQEQSMGVDLERSLMKAANASRGEDVKLFATSIAIQLRSGGNLADRLTKIEEPSQLAEELYLSTLTRLPTEEERNDVAEHLKDRSADRAVAVGELVWALLSSNEFRFNH